jgi:hypothetical protein
MSLAGLNVPEGQLLSTILATTAVPKRHNRTQLFPQASLGNLEQCLESRARLDQSEMVCRGAESEAGLTPYSYK